jgi:hypothetical protein
MLHALLYCGGMPPIQIVHPFEVGDINLDEYGT